MRKIRRARPRRRTDFDSLALDRGQQARDVVVEAVVAAVGVADGQPAVAAAFERGRDVRVDPEGPEGVVEVEDDELGQRERRVRQRGGQEG